MCRFILPVGAQTAIGRSGGRARLVLDRAVEMRQWPVRAALAGVQCQIDFESRYNPPNLAGAACRIWAAMGSSSSKVSDGSS